MTSATEVNADYITYILSEANALARLDEFEIDSYMDRELLNPEMKAFLATMPDTDMVAMDDGAPLALSLFDNRALGLFDGFRAKFRNFKRTVKRELCKILADLQDEGTLDWPTIITAALTALAAVFFATPFGLVILPVLAALIAKIIRRGIEAVCAV